MTNNEFCTLFDVNYLLRGLVLYRSLARVVDDFRLRVFCMDDETHELLSRLALPGLVPVSLAELETHDAGLLETKPTRGPVDYLLTATPAICLFSLEREPELPLITYLDADLMFFSDPAPLFEELGDESVLITPHRYAPEWQHWERISGVYNVQFVTFRRDERGLETLRWWRERCLEWCYFRPEDGKLGDQKYLDDWPERFAGVHVLEHPGGGLAPWNASAHELRRSNGGVLVDGRTLVFYHHHSLQLYRGAWLRRVGLLSRTYRLTAGLVWATTHPMTETERTAVWEPYVRELAAALGQIRAVRSRFDAGFKAISSRRLALAGVRLRLNRLLRRVYPRRPDRQAATTGWREESVALAMRKLAVGQLERPDEVPPYRAFLSVMRSLLDRFAGTEPVRLLDFGCGVGHYSELLEREFPGRFEYVGCDFAETMVEAARSQWPGRTFVVNDVYENSLDLDEFDVVFASALVDVLDQPERALGVLLGADAPFVILHRQRFVDGPSRVETAPGYDGQVTFRSYVSRSDLADAAEAHGREIALEVPVESDISTVVLSRRDAG